MAGVWSTQFVCGYTNSHASAEALGFTVPAGKIAVVRAVDLFSDTATTTLFFVRTLPTMVPFFSSKDAPIYTTRHWAGHAVFVSGQRFGPRWIAGAGWCQASGFLLDAS